MRSVTLLSTENISLYSCAADVPPENISDPPRLGREALASTGTLRITSTEGREIAYLHLGTFSHPLMRRTRIWRVNNRLIFKQPTPGRFWALEIPFGRVDVILSKVCALLPKIDTASTTIEEIIEDQGTSPLVRDAIELCSKRSVSVRSQASSCGSQQQPAVQREPVGVLKSRPSFDARFDDADVEEYSNVSHKFSSFLDSDSENEWLGIDVGSAASTLAGKAKSRPAKVLEPAFTPQRTPQRTQRDTSEHPQPAKTPIKTPIKREGLNIKLQPTPEGQGPRVPAHTETKSPRAHSSPLVHSPLAHSPRHSPERSPHPSPHRTPKSPPFKNEAMRTLEAIMAGSRGTSPSDEDFRPISPRNLAKHPVFIATPPSSFSEIEFSASSSQGDLFSPDSFASEPEYEDFKGFFKHPLIPATNYPLPDRPALRTKDLVRIGTHTGQEIATVGAFISWQMLCRTSVASNAPGAGAQNAD